MKFHLIFTFIHLNPLFFVYDIAFALLGHKCIMFVLGSQTNYSNGRTKVWVEHWLQMHIYTFSGIHISYKHYAQQTIGFTISGRHYLVVLIKICHVHFNAHNYFQFSGRHGNMLSYILFALN